ncbi:hypothetical protein GCM10028805_26000 [Spirosoma harenae]
MNVSFPHFLKTGWLALLMMGFSFTLWAKPSWTFKVVVAVEKQTADFHQSLLSKPIDQIVREQMAVVNANFNSSTNFNGIYDFRVDSIYIFDGPTNLEIFRPHPNYDYCVVIDGFSTTAQGGGWLGDYQTIYHKWPANNVFASGPFGPGATDGLTHEFGHARGAVDIYGMRVEGSKNPVNGETFEPVNSVMNYPYGNITWDEYTVNLLNSTGGDYIQGDEWIKRPFPSKLGIKAVSTHGSILSNVSLTIYPVEWFSNKVSYIPIGGGSTDSDGVYSFSSNPYQPATKGYPWTMRYCNFLIKAVYNSVTVYKWMPLYDVQNAYFRNGENSTNDVEIVFPESTPLIQLSSISATSFYPGNTIEVSFALSDAFGPGNVFSLFVVDKNNNSYEITSMEGRESGTITGTIPDLSPDNSYKIRIVSSKPIAQSNDFQITINPTPPSRLTLLAPTYNCQTGFVVFNTKGGDGSPITFTAPGITRVSPTSSSGMVEYELRNDPKDILITASQGDVSVSYTFKLKAACTNVVTPKPPLLIQPIPDQFLMVRQPLPVGGFNVGFYFADPTPFVEGYLSGWLFQIEGLPEGLYVFSKEVPGFTPNPVRIIQGVPNKEGVYIVTIKASTAAFPDRPVITSFRIIVTNSNPTSGLTLLQPTYNCQTGAIHFNSTGGDGSSIEFMAAGITGWTLNPDQFVDTESRTAKDVSPFTIWARQSGLVVSYNWDLRTYCQGRTTTLQLLAPTYNCNTGAIHFNTSGGDGSPIEYMAFGITDWTTNPNQYVDKESRTVNDVQPFTLLARQSGATVIYVWDLKTACGWARLGVEENHVALSLTVLGNPVQDQFRVLIQGAESQGLQLILANVAGKVVESRWIEQAGRQEQQMFRVGQAPSGILVLQAITATQKQSIRIIKN